MPDHSLGQIIRLYNNGLITYEEARDELGFHPVANATVTPEVERRYHD